MIKRIIFTTTNPRLAISIYKIEQSVIQNGITHTLRIAETDGLFEFKENMTFEKAVHCACVFCNEDIGKYYP